MCHAHLYELSAQVDEIESDLEKYERLYEKLHSQVSSAIAQHVRDMQHEARVKS